MYAYIKGQYTLKTPTDVYIETKDGVAYHLNISLHTYSQIESAEDGLLYTYLHVKEDDLSLYGFSDQQERALFIHLISVSGIGPNTARVVLSSMPPLEVRTAIVTENDLAFKKVKGIGPKTAKRLILDLKDKLRKSGEHIDPAVVNTTSTVDEATQALVALGFQKQKISKVLSTVDAAEHDTVEKMLKYALSRLT